MHTLLELSEDKYELFDVIIQSHGEVLSGHLSSLAVEKSLRLSTSLGLFVKIIYCGRFPTSLYLSSARIIVHFSRLKIFCMFFEILICPPPCDQVYHGDGRQLL